MYLSAKPLSESHLFWHEILTFKRDPFFYFSLYSTLTHKGFYAIPKLAIPCLNFAKFEILSGNAFKRKGFLKT